jgi:hypothetical protein
LSCGRCAAPFGGGGECTRQPLCPPQRPKRRPRGIKSPSRRRPLVACCAYFRSSEGRRRDRRQDPGARDRPPSYGFGQDITKIQGGPRKSALKSYLSCARWTQSCCPPSANDRHQTALAGSAGQARLKRIMSHHNRRMGRNDLLVFLPHLVSLYTDRPQSGSWTMLWTLNCRKTASSHAHPDSALRHKPVGWQPSFQPHRFNQD